MSEVRGRGGVSVERGGVEPERLYLGVGIKLQRADARALLSRVAGAQEARATAHGTSSPSEAALAATQGAHARRASRRTCPAHAPTHGAWA